MSKKMQPELRNDDELPTAEKQGKFKKIFAISIAGLLVLALASFGLLEFKGGGQDYVVKVEGKKVTPIDFSSYIDTRRKELIMKFGSVIIEPLLNRKEFEFGIANELLENLLIAKELEDLGIVVNKATVNEFVLNSPNFRGSNGKFDAGYYRAYLAQMGLSEPAFITSQIYEIRSRFINEVLGTIENLDLEKIAVNLLVAQNQKRVVAVKKIPLSSAASLEVNEKEILSYYIKNKEMFATEEAKTVLLAKIDAETVKSRAISNEEILKAYNEEYVQKNQKVSFYRLDFSDEGDALKALNLMKNEGLSITEVGSNMLGMDAGRVYIKNFDVAALRPEVKTPLLKLKNGELSNVVMIDGNYTILRMEKVSNAGFIPSLDSVKNKIVTSLKSTNSCKYVEKLAESISTELESGEPLANVVSEAMLGAQTTTLIEGSPNRLIPQKIRETISADTDITYSKIIKNQPCEYYAYSILEINPKTYKALDEVKSEVIKLAKIEKNKELAFSIANKEYAELQKKPLKSGSLVLARDSAEFEPNIIESVFMLNAGEALPPVFLPKTQEYALIQLTEVRNIKPESLKEAEITKMQNELKKQQKSELRESYIKYLKTKYKHSINYALVRPQ